MSFWHDDTSQSLIEYAVLVGLLTVCAVVLGMLIGGAVTTLLGGGSAGSGGTPEPTPAPVPSSRP